LKFIFIFLTLLTAVSFRATAEEPARQTLLEPSAGGDLPLEIHGFLSQGFLQTTGNNYLPNSKEGTTDFADAGLTLNKQLRSDLRAGMQLFARDFGRTGNYSAKFDWFLMDYHWRDWLGLRAGRIKIPYGLYNETNDIDITRASILLPQSVYPTDQRDYLLSQTGFDLYGYIDLASAGSLDYRAYRGTLQIDAASTVGLPYQIATSDVPFIHGARLIWESPGRGLRVGATYQSLQLNSDLYIPTLLTTIATTLKVTMGVGSVELTTQDFQFAAEYARWWGAFDSNMPAVLVPARVSHERYYGMASYRAQEWLHPGIAYAVTYPNMDVRDNAKDFAKDSALFCRWDLTANWTFKLEWHYMEGTAGLIPAMNDGKANNNMDRYWNMYLAKTTLFF
jgi:hypothetical protein